MQTDIYIESLLPKNGRMRANQFCCNHTFEIVMFEMFGIHKNHVFYFSVTKTFALQSPKSLFWKHV